MDLTDQAGEDLAGADFDEEVHAALDHARDHVDEVDRFDELLGQLVGDLLRVARELRTPVVAEDRG